jgi:dTDP-4-amino-4,6-dideoxygalactose transaminase
LIKALAEKGIGSMCYYPVPLHLQTAFKKLKYKKGDFPISETVAKEVLSLPIYPELNTDDIIYVAKTLTDIMAKTSTAVAVPVAVPTLLG